MLAQVATSIWLSSYGVICLHFGNDSECGGVVGSIVVGEVEGELVGSVVVGEVEGEMAGAAWQDAK